MVAQLMHINKFRILILRKFEEVGSWHELLDLHTLSPRLALTNYWVHNNTKIFRLEINCYVEMLLLRSQEVEC